MPITSMNENLEQNEGAPRKQEKQKSKQPARTHYNLRSQTNRQELGTSLTDREDV